MADKKKSGISIMPVFVDGEQPSAAKFNSIGVQVKRSDYILESSIGDIWGESWPYSTTYDAKLSLDTIAFNGTNFMSNTSKGLDLNIASLGRLIGPASLLDVDVCSYDENGIANHQVVETVPKGVNQFTLKYVPSNTPSFSLNNIFSNQVATAVNLSSPGDYFIDLKGNVITVTPTPNSSGGTVIYRTKPIDTKGGGDAIGNTFNSIPSARQIELPLSNSSAHLTLVRESDGVYLVELPHRSHNISNADLTTTTMSSAHPDRNQKYILPLALTLICGGSELSLGTDSPVSNIEIPEGMLYLKNESTGQVYTEATYYYVSNTSFRIQLNETLNIGVDKFSVITVGSNITSNIRSLKMKQNAHSHSRDFGEPLISIEDIDGIFKYPGESGIFIPSLIQNNYTPQYLHRDGSRGTDGGLNDDNAMRGDLVIGRRMDANGNSITEAGNYLGEGSSYYLSFGNIGVNVPRIGKFYNTFENLGTFQIQSGAQCAIQMLTNNYIELLASGATGSAISLIAANAGIELNSKNQTNIIADNEINIIADDNEGLKTSGGLSIGHTDSGLAFEARDAVSENIWFHPRIHQVHLQGANEIVYAYQDRLDTISGPATSETSANFLFKNITLPSWLNYNGGCRVIGVEVLWSPGSSHNINNNNGLQAGFDESTQFPETYWYGSNSNYSKNYSTGIAWTLTPNGIMLYWPLDTDGIGSIGNAIIDPESLFVNSNGEYYANMDYRITITYRRV